jgi:hypothetical protein
MSAFTHLIADIIGYEADLFVCIVREEEILVRFRRRVQRFSSIQIFASAVDDISMTWTPSSSAYDTRRALLLGLSSTQTSNGIGSDFPVVEIDDGVELPPMVVDLREIEIDDSLDMEMAVGPSDIVFDAPQLSDCVYAAIFRCKLCVPAKSSSAVTFTPPMLYSSSRHSTVLHTDSSKVDGNHFVSAILKSLLWMKKILFD